MNSFGLGLVLNFTDNATAGIGNATRAFQQMSSTADSVASSVGSSITSIVTASYALDSVGSTLVNTGSSIIDLYGSVSQSVINAGMEMQGYRMQLSALYGSMDAGEAKMQEIKDYAMSSVFDIQSLIPAVTTMKAVGIEAMDDITTSSGKATQKLLDYASDLAAMMPNMRNAYGTGVSAAMGAFKEYIAEGNAMSLKRGAGLDITQILGEAKGTTIEKRTQQVADLIEKLNIVGYTTSLAGTPTQRLSNMQDALFNSLTKIADSGVFEKYCDLLEMLSNWVFSLVENEDTFNVITGVLADTITALLSPLTKVLDFIIRNSNSIIEWIKNNQKLTKTILLVIASIGGLLVAGGLALKLISSIGMASVGLQFLRSLPVILSVVGKGFSALILRIVPFLALAGLAYLVWKNNLFGIRDTITQVFKEIGTLFSLVFDAWDDNTLSEESFQKAKNLGILPFIEAILDLRYLWGVFTDGFKKGFSEVFDYIDKFSAKISPVSGFVYDLANNVGTFLKDVFNVQTDSDSWLKVGEAFGMIAGALTIAIPLIMTAVKAFGLIKGVIALATSPIGLIVLAIAAVVAAVVGLKYAWDNNLGGIQEKARSVFESILGFYNTYLAPFVSRVVTFVGTIIAIVRNLWETWLKPIFIQLGGFFSSLWTNSLQPLLQKVGSFALSVVNFVWSIVNILLSLWNNILAPIVNWLVTVLAPVVNGIVQIILGVIEYVFITISDIVGGILTVFQGVLDFFTGIFTGDWELVWSGICDIFKGIWETLTGIVKGVVNGIITIINTLISTVYSVLAAVVNGIGSIFNTIASAIGIDANVGIPETAPQIPYLAEGGVATDKTTAVIGEGEDDEAVLPLNTKVFNEIAKGISNQKPAQSQQTVQNDYSVTFSAGSIVIQLANATDAELEKAAEKLMKIIERKQQLKAMAVRA